MEIKKVKLKDIDIANTPVRHLVLPEGCIERIVAFKRALGDAEPMTIEEAVSNFQKDMHPEREIEIWERVASKYQDFLTRNSSLNSNERKEVFSVLIGTSMGREDFSELKNLSEDQIKYLVDSYTDV